MKVDRKTMLSYLTGANDTLERIREIEERMASRTIKITQSYGDVGGSNRSNPQVSKVERYVEEKIELEEELAKCKERLILVEQVKKSGILTKIEYELIEWLQIGGRMSDFARQHKIYKSYVYKIRDNALEKLVVFVQTTPKCDN